MSHNSPAVYLVWSVGPTPVRHRRLLTPSQILVVTVRLTPANGNQLLNTGRSVLRLPNLPSLDVRSLPVPRMELNGPKWSLQTHNDGMSLSHSLQRCTNASRRSTPT